jgi:uncharacterized protein (DUF1778 family)
VRRKSAKRKRVLFVRLAPDEQKLIAEAAECCGLAMAVYARTRLLDTARADVQERDAL